MSTLRATLRSRLTSAMRARDRDAVAVLRSAVAALENAEAVPVVDPRLPSTASGNVAGAAVGVGATEAARRELDPATERAILESEVTALGEAERAYAVAGDASRARTAAAGADLLRSVLGDADRTS